MIGSDRDINSLQEYVVIICSRTFFCFLNVWKFYIDHQDKLRLSKVATGEAPLPLREILVSGPSLQFISSFIRKEWLRSSHYLFTRLIVNLYTKRKTVTQNLKMGVGHTGTYGSICAFLVSVVIMQTGPDLNPSKACSDCLFLTRVLLWTPDWP